MNHRRPRSTSQRSRPGSSAATTLAVLAAVAVVVLPGVAIAAGPQPEQPTTGPATADQSASAPSPDATDDGWYNGQLPQDQLQEVGGVLLAPDAARDMARLLQAAEADGVEIVLTDGYRSYQRQVRVRADKGDLAARPGTSMHGWGLAVDVHTGRSDMAWLHRNAGRFGWILPPWAQPDGSKPEPWHWEYVGTHRSPTDPDRFTPGEPVATAWFAPADRPPGEPFEIREGLLGFDGTAQHYPGTALPGQPGNMGIAGYRYDRGAPLRGIDELRPGDAIFVRASDGGEHRYEVLGSGVVTDLDTWALAPDPFATGATSMLTITTSAGPGLLSVVWAQAR